MIPAWNLRIKPTGAREGISFAFNDLVTEQVGRDVQYSMCIIRKFTVLVEEEGKEKKTKDRDRKDGCIL